MKRSASNSRRSQWEVVHRCFALLHRLMQAPAPLDDLLAIIYEYAAAEGQILNRQQALKWLENDRNRLRYGLGCEIVCDRSTDIYTLISIESPLIDLTPEALRGLAFLIHTFDSSKTPMSAEVMALVDQVKRLLSEERRQALGRERGLLELELRQRDTDHISDDVWEAVKTACSQRRQLEFDYYASQDGLPRRHLVEPYRHYFSPAGGHHYYLEAYWIHSFSEPYGLRKQEIMFNFRLGRMKNPKVLPTHFPLGKRRVPSYELIYELSPKVARLGVTEYFKDSKIEQREDGSVIVRATSTNLFQDLRILLHYGGNCRVIGGEKAVQKMKELVEEMYKQYQTD